MDASFCFRESECFIVVLIRPESLHVFVNARTRRSSEQATTFVGFTRNYAISDAALVATPLGHHIIAPASSDAIRD